MQQIHFQKGYVLCEVWPRPRPLMLRGSRFAAAALLVAGVRAALEVVALALGVAALPLARPVGGAPPRETMAAFMRANASPPGMRGLSLGVRVPSLPGLEGRASEPGSSSSSAGSVESLIASESS